MATNEEKNTHLGDLFYNPETGHAFRFMLDENNNYVLTLLPDSDVADALEAAQKKPWIQQTSKKDICRHASSSL